MKRARGRLSLAAAALVVGCNAIVDHAVVQCTTDASCDARGGDFVGTACVDSVCRDPLACLGDDARPPAEDADRPVGVRARFVDLDDEPVAGATVFVCLDGEPGCASSYADETYRTDGDGYVYAMVPTGFRGTLEVREKPEGFAEGDHAGDFIPTVLYPRLFPAESEPRDKSIEPAKATRLMTVGDLTRALEPLGSAFQKDKALAFGTVFDCNGRPLSGATVSAAPLTGDAAGAAIAPRFYDDAEGAPATDAKATGARGAFGFGVLDPSKPLRLEVKLGPERWTTVDVKLLPGHLTAVSARYAR